MEDRGAMKIEVPGACCRCQFYSKKFAEHTEYCILHERRVNLFGSNALKKPVFCHTKFLVLYDELTEVKTP